LVAGVSASVAALEHGRFFMNRLLKLVAYLMSSWAVTLLMCI